MSLRILEIREETLVVVCFRARGPWGFRESLKLVDAHRGLNGMERMLITWGCCILRNPVSGRIVSTCTTWWCLSAAARTPGGSSTEPCGP